MMVLKCMLKDAIFLRYLKIKKNPEEWIKTECFNFVTAINEIPEKQSQSNICYCDAKENQ